MPRIRPKQVIRPGQQIPGFPFPQYPPNPPNQPNQPTQSNQPPVGPPPNFTPSQSQGTKVGATPTKSLGGGPVVYAVDPGAIFPCQYQFTYIWPSRGPGFWMYVTYVGRKSIAGWRYRNYRWYYFGIDLNQVDSFYC